MTPAMKQTLFWIAEQNGGSVSVDIVGRSQKGILTRLIKAGLVEIQNGRYIAIPQT